jgi:hypothetical protein
VEPVRVEHVRSTVEEDKKREEFQNFNVSKASTINTRASRFKVPHNDSLQKAVKFDEGTNKVSVGQHRWANPDFKHI